MTSTHHETVRLMGDGVELAAAAFGPADGPPVLFFHGGGQSGRSWHGSARRIAAEGYRALSFDLRGHGQSGWAPDGNYLLEAYGRDVERLVEQLARPVSLVGASRGGQAALIGGSRHASRVSLIMLADVAPLIVDEGVERFRGFFRASTQGFASLEEAADALAHHLERPRLADASGLARAMRRGADGRLYWHWDPRTVSPEFLNPPSESLALQEAAARVRCPVVMVRAEHSELVSDEAVALFRRLTPQLEVVEAKGVGHMFTGDRNDAFAATLLEHLQRLAPVAP